MEFEIFVLIFKKMHVDPKERPCLSSWVTSQSQVHQRKVFANLGTERLMAQNSSGTCLRDVVMLHRFQKDCVFERRAYRHLK